MATAVQTTAAPRTPNPRAKLALASLFGAAFILAGVAVAAYLVPVAWGQVISPAVRAFGPFVDWALRLATQAAVVGGIVYAGSLLAGSNPPRGIRGGIFLVISLAIAVFFVVRAVGLNLEESQLGLPITVVVLGGLLGLCFRFMVSPRAAQWMVAIEEQGWLSTFHYKRTQGVRLRRYTLIGFLLLGWTGVYTLLSHGTLGTGDWTLRLPFTPATVTLLSVVEYSVPLLLAAATFWLAWRAVNMPQFADFLIATEAEMNKVSWSSRKRLVQDTVVVLVTVVLLTVFLLVVDLFWGWLLSQVDVLRVQPKGVTSGQVDPLQGKKADW